MSGLVHLNTKARGNGADVGDRAVSVQRAADNAV